MPTIIGESLKKEQEKQVKNIEQSQNGKAARRTPVEMQDSSQDAAFLAEINKLSSKYKAKSRNRVLADTGYAAVLTVAGPFFIGSANSSKELSIMSVTITFFVILAWSIAGYDYYKYSSGRFFPKAPLSDFPDILTKAQKLKLEPGEEKSLEDCTIKELRSLLSKKTNSDVELGGSNETTPLLHTTSP